MGSISRFGRPLRELFPFFGKEAYGLDAAFLDSAASSQKPKSVIDAIYNAYSANYANVHRGAYRASAISTEAFEESRQKIQHFLGAKYSREIIFTKGATEALNLLASSLNVLESGEDVVLLSIFEHHSNIVPWLMAKQSSRCSVEYVGATNGYLFDMEDFKSKLRQLKPKVVSVAHISNVLGTVLPIGDIVEESHRIGALVVVDACQSVPHLKLDVRSLECDFLVFSAHKAYGPTGAGVLYVKEDHFDKLRLYQGGGGMIADVEKYSFSPLPPPHAFEAGTPAICEVVALSEMVNFFEKMDLGRLKDWEDNVLSYGVDLLLSVDGLDLYLPQNSEMFSTIVSFNLKGIHPHDFSTVADSENVQVRAGHHCALPLLRRFGLQSTVRASVGCYSCREDFDRLATAIKKAHKIFSN